MNVLVECHYVFHCNTARAVIDESARRVLHDTIRGDSRAMQWSNFVACSSHEQWRHTHHNLMYSLLPARSHAPSPPTSPPPPSSTCQSRFSRRSILCAVTPSSTGGHPPSTLSWSVPKVALAMGSGGGSNLYIKSRRNTWSVTVAKG